MGGEGRFEGFEGDVALHFHPGEESKSRGEHVVFLCDVLLNLVVLGEDLGIFKVEVFVVSLHETGNFGS